MSSCIIPVTTIDEIRPHGNADTLELATVQGWQVCVKKDEHKVGDVVVYFPPDSVLSSELADRLGVSQYLANGRTRSIKLRKKVSHGFVVPVDEVLAGITIPCARCSPPHYELPKVGDNVAELLGVTKYEPPVKSFHSNLGKLGGSRFGKPEIQGFPRYTDIENLRHHTHVLQDGEMVVVSEKVHGCVAYNVRIGMADGTFKRIYEVRIGDEILGVDDEGRLISTKVINTFNNGTAAKWLTVKGKRYNAGRGNSYWAVHCTPNHQFFVPGVGYQSAENLKRGDPVMLVRSELEVTPLQEQVILGKMLGDGYFHAASGSGGIHWGHKKSHSEYVEWTARALGALANGTRRTLLSGYGTQIECAHTIFNPYIATFCEGFVQPGKRKCVPEWVAEKLGPIALAFWFMDDGSLGHHSDQEDRAMFAVAGFTKKDCDVLIAGLKRLGINAVYYQSNGYSRIRLNADDAERMFLLIAPYVPPVMQYKLPERYRGHTGWLPTSDNEYKPMLVEQTVDEVFENTKIKSSRWDIETETHNFFANGILVHNSNSRVALVNGKYEFGSRKVRRTDVKDEHLIIAFIKRLFGRRAQRDYYEKGLYAYPLTIPSVQCLLQALGQRHKSVVLYGEIYGKDIQAFDYGVEHYAYAAFDLLVDGTYLPWPEMSAYCQEYDVPTVKCLDIIPYSLDVVKELADGPAFQGKHIREGVVVKPVQERRDP